MTSEPRHTRRLRALGCGALVVFLALALVAWAWVWAVVAVSVFVGTALLASVLNAVDRIRDER